MEVRYILEAKYGSKTERIYLPYVGHIDFARAHAVNTTWTLGKVPFHQYSGVRQQNFHLSGRSGIKQRFDAPSLFDFTNVSADMSGPALFREVEKFLEKFETKAFEAQQSYTELPKLSFKALWEEKSFYVTHANFAWVRDKGNSRFSYEWNLDMHAYADLEKEPAKGIHKFLQGFFAVTSAMTTAINAASVAVNDATRVLQSIERSLDRFKEPLRAVASFAGEVRKLGQSFDNIVRFPQTFFNEFFIALSHSISLVFEAWARLPFFDKDTARATMFRVLSSLAEARRAVVAVLGLNFIGSDFWDTGSYEKKGQTLLTQKQSGLKTGTITPGYVIVGNQVAVVYEVKSGESLHDIAQDVIGSREAWVEIAELNGMTSATTLPSGLPLVAGTTLLVPVPGNSPIVALGPKDIYGTDILVQNGDLVISGLPGVDAQDVRTVAGMDNLRQALKHRLITEKGDNTVFPDYGIPKIVGYAPSAYKVAEAAAEVRIQFGAEQRIESVRNLEVIDNGNLFIVNALVTPVAGQAFTVNIPVSTV